MIASLTQLAQRNDLAGSHLTGIGGFSRAVLGFFDPDEKDYERITVDEQTEVASLVGDIALEGDRPKVHIHAVLSRRDGSTIGGHILEGVVRPTLEVVLTEEPSDLHRRHDPQTGLPLIDL